MTHSKKSKRSKKSTVRDIRVEPQADMPDEKLTQNQLEQVAAGGGSMLLTSPESQEPWPPCDTDE